MTVTTNPAATAATAEARRDDLAGRLMAAALGALEMQAVYLGDRLGLYRSLAEEGPATPGELAERAGIHARYAQEWLEQQAVAGVLDVDDMSAAPDERRYALPDGHAAVLIDLTSPWLVAPISRFVMGSAQTMPALLAAYRTGEGVDWADYGPDVIEAQEALNRPQFASFVGDWIAALPDIAAKLRDGDGRVADVACGTGWSSISIARAFPGIKVDGIDIDAGSIERARMHTEREGLGDRVSFLFADAADADGAAGEGRYDLVTIFEAVHDMAQPAAVLATARKLLKPGGAVLIGDERVAEVFTAPGDETERLFFGYSVVACLANGLHEQPSIGTGTVLRPAVLETIAREAGYSGFQVLPTEHDTFRFYRLDP
jgi:2-polyprenyl-3-methyl-5-hydroxy-6-metoxy-1,4-benzoquinol methylase